MPVRERECGELPSPNLSLSDRKVGQGHFVGGGEVFSQPKMGSETAKHIKRTSGIFRVRVLARLPCNFRRAGRPNLKPLLGQLSGVAAGRSPAGQTAGRAVYFRW